MSDWNRTETLFFSKVEKEKEKKKVLSWREKHLFCNNTCLGIKMWFKSVYEDEDDDDEESKYIIYTLILIIAS